MSIAGDPGLRAPRFTALPPLSLYVHIPWCMKKCPYCDFNSHERRGDVPEARYVDALIADLEFALPSIWGRRVDTVFFGGGTPSLFSAGAIDRILGAVRARVPLSPDAEITLEANPGTFEQHKFTDFKAAGINRLSLGVQSFDLRFLAALGRVHDDQEARAAGRAALTIFGNVNFDLMYALPGQTLDDARADVTKALEFSPPHLSFYHLTIEPNTLFHRRPPQLPDDDVAADIENAVEDALARAGYVHYETSAHAQPGFACRHNLNYWRFGDYLGIGAGAHAKLTDAESGAVRRRWKVRAPRGFLELAGTSRGIGGDDTIAATRLPFEFMLNALRLNAGFPLVDFAATTGIALAAIQPQIDTAVARDWLEIVDDRIRATALGQRFLNDVIASFLPD